MLEAIRELFEANVSNIRKFIYLKDKNEYKSGRAMNPTCDGRSYKAECAAREQAELDAIELNIRWLDWQTAFELGRQYEKGAQREANDQAIGHSSGAVGQ